ncbi:MAG: CDGSH iron-sulfur domain-containing protein [Gemmatimonadota bacterium]
MSEVKLTVTRNGPVKVEGPFQLLDDQGEPVATREGKAIFLCRCGGSTNKPFCDGTHSRIGFLGAEAAVAAEQDS